MWIFKEYNMKQNQNHIIWLKFKSTMSTGDLACKIIPSECAGSIIGKNVHLPVMLIGLAQQLCIVEFFVAAGETNIQRTGR